MTEEESYTWPKKAVVVLAVLNGRNQRAHRSDLTSGKRTGRSARTRTRFLHADSNKLKLCAPKSKASARTMMLMPPPLCSRAACLSPRLGRQQAAINSACLDQTPKKEEEFKTFVFFQHRSLGDAAKPMCNAAISNTIIMHGRVMMSEI